MKLLFFTGLIFTLSAAAMVKKASIDDALSHKYDENYEETNRGVAAHSPKKVESEKVEKSGERNPSAQGEVFEQQNENGIRYWKY